MSAAREDGEYSWWCGVGRRVAKWGRGDWDRLCWCFRGDRGEERGEGGVEEEGESG